MNNNHRTDYEFENFLEKIGGINISHKPHLSPIKERRYFGIGNGWLGILQRLFEVLIEMGWDKSFINVKEKFGGMSIFIDNLPDSGDFVPYIFNSGPSKVPITLFPGLSDS